MIKSKIDARVRRLVDALNELPGIFTFSSCHGHEDDSHSGRCPAGEFYVNFSADIPGDGLRSLSLIALKSQEIDGISVNVWCNTDNVRDAVNTLSFEVRGHNGADPDKLAVVIVGAGRSKRPRNGRKGRKPAERDE